MYSVFALFCVIVGTLAPRPPPVGWVAFSKNKHIFPVINVNVTWDFAKSSCEKAHPDSTLLVVANQAESNSLGHVIRHLDATNQGSKFWVGLEAGGGEPIWHDGSQYVVYGNVALIRPSGNGAYVAFAVSDGPQTNDPFTYNFLTAPDTLEGYICQTLS